MTDDPEARARGRLAELEEVLAAKNLDQITDLFSDDVVLIGDAVENFDRKSTVAYLALMAEMEPTVRWNWDRIAVFEDAPAAFSFAAAGTIWFDKPSGRRTGDPEPFRVTCFAVQEGDRWRWRHFHGSRPEAD